MNAQGVPADGRALPEISPAVREAQERLWELRRQQGVAQTVSLPPSRRSTDCQSVAPHAAEQVQEPVSPDWDEIARRSLFSQTLVEHLRKRVASGGGVISGQWSVVSGVFDAAQDNAVSSAPLPPRPPAPPPLSPPAADHPSSLIPHPSLRLHPDLALAILRRKKAAAGRVWLLLRHADAAGRGAVTEDEAARLLTGDGSPLRICGRRHLANLLAAGEGLFWQRRAGVIWLRGLARVAAGLGVRRLGGNPVAVPLRALTGSIGDVRAHLYASFHSGRQTTDLLSGAPRPRGPIARATLTALSAAAPNSQRAYERRARVVRHEAVAVGPPVGAADEQEVAWRRGRAMFHLRDNEGRHGRPGAVYLAWQLPNEYTGPHAALPRGRQKRLNRALADLFHDGMTGNGEREERGQGAGGRGQWSVDSGQYLVGSGEWRVAGVVGVVGAVGGEPPAVGRRFYGCAKAAWLARHDRERYWRGPRGRWYWQGETGARDQGLGTSTLIPNP